jgi:DNA-binding transcriptional MerR regulator
MASQEPIRKRSGGGSNRSAAGASTPPAREIPDKLYFRIGEVAKLCEVPAYVLRFWEGEFPQLKPNKGGTGQRLYRRRDVEMALRIKTLLYDEGYTIPGARQAFKAELRSGKEPQLGIAGVAETPAAAPGAAVAPKHLVTLRKELQEILKLLSKPAVAKSSVQPIRRGFSAPRPEPVAELPAPRPFPKPQLLKKLGPTLFDD